jgi:hypothetical protein
MVVDIDSVRRDRAHETLLVGCHPVDLEDRVVDVARVGDA